MTTIWTYQPSIYEFKPKDIPIRNTFGNEVGTMTRKIPNFMSYLSLYVQLSWGSDAHLTYEFISNDVYLVADTPIRGLGITRSIYYRKGNEEHHITVERDNPFNLLGFEGYSFTYKELQYIIKQRPFGESQLLLGENIIATWEREKSLKAEITYAVDQQHIEDAWLWLTIFHSCYGNDRRNFLSSILPF
jgi:hypothetical protein